MWTFLLSSAALLAAVSGVCYNYEQRYYLELGCRPELLGEDGCPTSYDCSGRSHDKCWYHGSMYEEGYTFQNHEDCLAECSCRKSLHDNKLVFSCVNIECPEVFTRPPPPNCYRTYEFDKCCKVDDVCVEPASDTPKPVCEYKNHNFQVGQRFYVNEGCLQCICQLGFNGSFQEPFCRKISCNLELVYGSYIADGCVPVYYGQYDCCPIGWRCPKKTDTVVQTTLPPDNSTKAPGKALECQFGEVRLQVGDRLSRSEEWSNTECVCRVPPHPICIMTRVGGN